jgi:tricorn protease
MVAPRGGFYDINGEWAVEGEGIAPDIEVIQEPKLVLEGKNPQLEKAVEEALRLLKMKEFKLKPELKLQFAGRGRKVMKINKKFN